MLVSQAVLTHIACSGTYLHGGVVKGSNFAWNVCSDRKRKLFDTTVYV